MFTRTHLGFAAATLLAATRAFAVPEVIFDNTSGAPDTNLSAVNGFIYADDVTFGGTGRTVTELSVGVLFFDSDDFQNITADVTAFLYDVGVGGAPGALLWSDTRPAELFDVNGAAISRLVTFTGINTVVGSSALWGVSFTSITGVSAQDFFGVQLGSTSSVPAGSANNPGTGTPAGGGIFINTGSGFVRNDITGDPDVLAVSITADTLVPEPTTASLLGVAALVLRLRRRKA